MKSSALLGYWLAFAGVLILSPDALLIRLAGDDPWQITAWRGTLSGLVIVAYCAFIGQSTLTQQLKPAGSLGLLGVTVSVGW